MAESPYSARETELLFKRIEDKLDAIKNSVDLKHKDTDKRLETVEDEVKRLTAFQNRAMTVWAIAVTAIGFFLNKLF